MFDEDFRVPDHGPWSATLGQDGRLLLSSDDFHHDAALLSVSGDFGGAAVKLSYGKFLADILTTGCRRARASAELADEGALLHALTQAAQGPQGELLLRAAEEIARLRTGLADAEKTLTALQAHRYDKIRVAEALEPSAFSQALAAALAGRQPTKR